VTAGHRPGPRIHLRYGSRLLAIHHGGSLPAPAKLNSNKTDVAVILQGRAMAKKLMLVSLLLLHAIGVAEAAGESLNLKRASSTADAAPLPSTHVQNLFQATSNVFSGSSPNSEAAFAEIARLGVKTVISVDGGKPDVETARKHGLRYIHLPIGYNGVPSNRVAELVKAAQTATGPLYVHCHHGKHRGPAAVAVVCQATASWTTNQAVTWLAEAGTAPDYAGLYRSAIEFRRPEAAALARVVELPDVAKTSSVVDAMVMIDEEFDRLKSAQRSSWKNIPGHPDISPAHTATILWEHFRELLRSADTAKRSEDYRAKLVHSEETANQLRSLLKSTKADISLRDATFQALGKTCTGCHKQYRN
jgi:hypothetical protein